MENNRNSAWLEKAKVRTKNKKWLKYSSKIASRVLAALEDKPGVNQAQLAKMLEVSPQQISKIVKGHENLTLETIAKISEALNVDLITFPAYKYDQPIIQYKVATETFYLANSIAIDLNGSPNPVYRFESSGQTPVVRLESISNKLVAV